MSAALAVLDEIMPSLTPAGSTRSDSLARPVEYEPDTLYGWPLSETFDPEGTGELDMDRFAIRLAWATDATAEVAAEVRERSTTSAIKAVLDSIQAWVRGHRSGTAYEHLQVTGVDWELITHSVRGLYIDLSGWTITS